jgi:hypothetical protein
VPDRRGGPRARPARAAGRGPLRRAPGHRVGAARRRPSPVCAAAEPPGDGLGGARLRDPSRPRRRRPATTCSPGSPGGCRWKSTP